MRSWTLVLAILGALGCGDDSDAQEGCPDTVEAWCAENRWCEGFETREDALESLSTAEGAVRGVRSCDDGNTITLGDGYGGVAYSYDDDGELVGVLEYSDAIQPDKACDPGNSSAGQASLACAHTGCALIAEPNRDRFEACTGSIAEPFVAMCREAVDDLEASCEACACTACYPALVSCIRIEAENGEPDAGGCTDSRGFSDCVEAQCAGPCAESPDPPAGDEDAGTP